MFIGIVGTECAGKSFIKQYLITRGFTELSLPNDHRPRVNGVQHMLVHATHNWQADHVTLSLRTRAQLEPFMKRPFFLLGARGGVMHDIVRSLVHVSVVNSFHSVRELEAHLDVLNLRDTERLRPGWDSYFMTLAHLASLRSNCMKRRVGAILVRSHRVISTGYNGTPRGLQNCADGGCARCNGSARSGQALEECLCLHAEENALLEAGRERVSGGEGGAAVLYCNTCPCLRCSVKIVQTGVREVVYNLAYSMDEASARVFKEAGVALRQHCPPA
ncbi:hypothetical protein DACRYDRAFT_51191 [Dacryopinax primogenitus]|uniref:Deoxycytidylate deaminase n=1 Tax=Dacryopinax primogenitus (strain DJM 731) TaxID=1858805 RepID=M5G9R7_DACPD|nr:uncharacterized protein DACRYDRAFT_51191 [Dacryopinax primogenitus]EJU02617.1 hypothetical protein DACRYDRAFT_51191 [Dacryopinax primogenitus]